MDSLRGRLLLAHPTLLDPNFRQTVVLIAEHGEEGALGLVLNRPSDIAVSEAAPDLEPLVEPGARVFVGGPVAQEGLLVLARFSEPAEAGLLVVADVGLVQGDADLTAVAEATRGARVFAGHAGWAPGQLEAELEAEGWIVEQPAPEEILAPEPEGLWGAVLARKGGRWALLARMPADPSVN